MKLAKPALLSSLALGVCLAANASDVPTDTQQNPASTQSGVVAGIDAATGKLRTLSDAEIRALSSQANNMATSRTANAAWAKMPQTEADAAKTFRRHANGMSSAELPLSAMNSLTVERSVDGQVTILENGAPLGHGRQEVSK